MTDRAQLHNLDDTPPNCRYIAFDTEFTQFEIPHLISLGASDGQNDFAVDLSNGWSLEDCNDFVKEVVLPIRESCVYPAVLASREEAAGRIMNWVDATYPDEAVVFACDYTKDAALLFELLLLNERFVLNDTRILGVAVVDINERGGSAFLSEAMNGLRADGNPYRRHNSLDDARMLAAAVNLMRDSFEIDGFFVPSPMGRSLVIDILKRGIQHHPAQSPSPNPSPYPA